MGERRTPRLALVVVAIFAVALAVRAAPLYWSSLPATTDGFRYARLAERLLATGVFPLSVIDSDEFVFTLGLATASAVTGIPPLRVAQGFVSGAGAGAPVVGAALAYRVATERGWPDRRALLATALTGFGLALDGIFLRRTGVPDEEALGLLLVPVLALAAHRWLVSGRTAWGISTALVLLVFPPLHNLSSLIGVLSVSAVVALYAVRASSTREVGRAGALGLGAWVVFLGYFEFAAWLGLRLTFSGLLRPYPGLFLAWVLALLIGVVWVRRTSRGLQRLTVLAPIGAFFLVVGLNTFTPVFPGTVPSPPMVVALVLGLAVPVGFAALGLPTVRSQTGGVVLATLLAPVVLIYYMLSASLTPEFFGAVIRTQSFAHVPAFVLAALGIAGLSALGPSVHARRRSLVAGAIVLFAVAVLLTLPLGYLNLDTGSYPSTTFESEFETTGFATEYVDGEFTTEHSLSRPAILYHTPLSPYRVTGDGTRVTVGPTRSWVRGAPPPDCPLLSQQSWTTTGAHLYPTAPGVVEPSRYEETLSKRNVVYTAGGYDHLVLSLPTNATGASESWRC
jgi:hypothetical protein